MRTGADIRRALDVVDAMSDPTEDLKTYATAYSDEFQGFYAANPRLLRWAKAFDKVAAEGWPRPSLAQLAKIHPACECAGCQLLYGLAERQ